MLLILKFIAKLLSVLNSEVSPRQIAAGFAMGGLIGFIPLKGILPIVLLLFSFIVNVNLPMVFLGAAVFKIISFVIDPYANTIGFYLLVQFASLEPLWTHSYNAPVIPYTRFNNTLVLGSLAVGLAAFLPLYFLARVGVVAYRTKFRDKIMKFKIVQMFKASRLFRYYESYKGMTGG